ncbi:MAG: gliding motility protein GldM, partial [Bacteroidia bacterium]
MASAKDTPRQKMIGMMYLVLTALLALNVSKDILDAFIVVNKGLENTNLNFTGHNEQLYSEFDLAKTVDPKRVTPNWKLAQQIKKQSAELTDYIDKLQKQLIAKTDGVPQLIADTMQMANISSKDNY